MSKETGDTSYFSSIYFYTALLTTLQSLHSVQILNQCNFMVKKHKSDSQGPLEGLQYFLIIATQLGKVAVFTALPLIPFAAEES